MKRRPKQHGNNGDTLLAKRQYGPTAPANYVRINPQPHFPGYYDKDLSQLNRNMEIYQEGKEDMEDE